MTRAINAPVNLVRKLLIRSEDKKDEPMRTRRFEDDSLGSTVPRIPSRRCLSELPPPLSL